jgi:8-oxo-dGTP pyrophosphatase MutT (NUDIX family)
MQAKQKKEISSGFVVYTIDHDRILYLLLRHPTHWSFPKGHMEHDDNNNLLTTAKREMFEETGIENFEIINGFHEILNYNFYKDNQLIQKEVHYFLARCYKKDKVSISKEHLDYGWFPLRVAYVKLKFENARELLLKANSFIKKLHHGI